MRDYTKLLYAVLTFHCDVADLIAMHNLIARFMPRRPGVVISVPAVDQQTGEGYVNVTLNTESASNTVKWTTSTSHTTQIIDELIRTRREPDLPTKEEWGKAILGLGIATKVELHFDNGCSEEWMLDISSGIVTGEEGKIFYQPGQEG
jgi:hypothetical protein